MNEALKRQRGAAILVAMLVLTLVATLAAGLQWRQWRMLQQESAARTQSQAAWVLVGALDWARLILREDARSATNGPPVDHLGEPWALPLQEAKLSSFLSAEALSDPSQDEAYLSGGITDAQAKINLTNLINGNVLSIPAMATLQNLYQQLNLPLPELQNWAPMWLASQPTASPNSSGMTPLRPQLIEQLSWLGVSESSIQILKDYVTILPQPTPINLNTASAIVIAATVPGINLAQAQKLVLARAQSPLQNVQDANNLLGISTNLSMTDFSVSTQYFEVLGQLRLGDWVLQEVSLVQRIGLNVTTIWRRKV
jgi:general secretion pathway protein K